MQEIAQRLAAAKHDRDTITKHLRTMFPNETHDACHYAATGAFFSMQAQLREPEQPLQQPPPLPSQRPYAPLPSETKPALPTRDKYNWVPVDGRVMLPAEARATRTIVPATIADMPCIFNGVPNCTHRFSWGTVTVEGVLMPSDLKQFTGVMQEVQNGDGKVAKNCLAAETSYSKVYGKVTGGKYGGSGCARMKRGFTRLHKTIIRVTMNDGTTYWFRLIESFETVKAPSGKRLLIRIGEVLTQRMCIVQGDKPIGCKPLELEPWRDLRGHTAIAYLMLDNLAALHAELPGHVGRIGLELLTERLNLKGSEPRRLHKLRALVERLDGLALSGVGGQPGGCLRLRIVRNNIHYERVLPAARAAA